MTIQIISMAMIIHLPERPHALSSELRDFSALAHSVLADQLHEAMSITIPASQWRKHQEPTRTAS